MENNQLERVKNICSLMRGNMSLENIPTAALILYKLSLNEMSEGRLYEIAQSLSAEHFISNPFKNSEDLQFMYNSLNGSFDADSLLLFYACCKNNLFFVPNTTIKEFAHHINSPNKSILICEGEKFAQSLKFLIDENKDSDITITVQDNLFIRILEAVFEKHENVHIMQTNIYEYEFIKDRFDLILSVPTFGGRLMVDQKQSFICREYELVAAENLLLHLNSIGKLLIVLPARITFSGGKVQELRRFIQGMYSLEEISELPSGTFSMTNIKTYLFAISTGKTEEVAIKRYDLFGSKKEDKYLKIKDETFVLSSELEDMGDWNIDKIFSSQDDEWMQYQESPIKKVSLEEVADIFRGKLVNTKDENGRIGVINISNIREYDINYDTLDHIDENERKISGHLLKDGDLLLPARGTAMRTAVFREQNYPCIASSNIIIIRPKKNKLSGTYLKIFLDSEIGGKILQSLQQGTTVMNISYKDLSTIQVPLLPFEDQKQIEEEYQKELNLYQKNILNAEEKWSLVIKKLKNKF